MIENLEDSGELESNYTEYVRSPTFSPPNTPPTAHFDETGSLTADKLPFRRPFLRRQTVTREDVQSFQSYSGSSSPNSDHVA